MTASTVTVTLSLVITCWEATGAAMICRLILVILSMTGTTKNTPGPLAPTQRPSRKITPRSYSWTILIDVARKRTTIPARTMPALKTACTAAPSGQGAANPGGGYGANRSGRAAHYQGATGA